MGTKEEDEDALLYGDVGDSDDEAKETMAKHTNVVVGGVSGGGEGVVGGDGDDEEKELEMKNDGDDDGIGAKEKTSTGDGAQTNYNNNNSNAEKNDEGEDKEKSKSVYVANLTWWTTDVQVEQLASEFGVVKSNSLGRYMDGIHTQYAWSSLLCAHARSEPSGLEALGIPAFGRDNH